VTSVSSRLLQFVEVLDLQPADRILEIGCGHGVAVSLICPELIDGHITAIDRSERMLAAARKRNAKWIERGVAEFILGDIESINLGDRRFNKALAARIGLFHRQPEYARKLTERWLEPGGQIFSFYDTPG
jgi:ubiquinone/menaquinone biosynthesis C-methylase UbiE